MARFFLDANLSPKTAAYLLTLGHQATSAVDLDLGDATDKKIAEYAIQNDLILITFDLDFGDITKANRSLKVVILRLSDEGIESTHSALRRLLRSLENTQIVPGMIFLVEDATMRIRRIST